MSILDTQKGFTQIGKFQEFNYPADAEQGIKSNLEFRLNLTPNTHIDCMRCPNCDNFMVRPEHGDAYQCNNCHTKFQTYGNAVFYWRDKKYTNHLIERNFVKWTSFGKFGNEKPRETLIKDLSDSHLMRIITWIKLRPETYKNSNILWLMEEEAKFRVIHYLSIPEHY